MDSLTRGFLEIRSKLDQIDAGIAYRRDTPALRQQMWLVLKRTVSLLRELEDEMTEEEREDEPWLRVRRAMDEIFETLQRGRHRP